MKKILSVLLIMIALFSLAACGEGDTVTIYIPETLTVYGGVDGKVASDVYYIFEDGWENKKTFEVTLGGAVEAVGTNTTSFTYSDSCLITLIEDATRTETRFDEKGRTVSTVTEYMLDAGSLTKSESIYTYDEHGRVLTQQTATYYSNREEPETASYTYTYRETEQGSEGTATVGNITETRFYDKNYRMVELRQEIGDSTVARMTYQYDAHGNQTGGESYVNGERMTKTVTTFKAVEVSRETADRLPQFKRET